ncbi:LysR family transcriptional regulator [Luteibacter aegosomaticola]|uniref:LysR family transcriptional regulator n=1 Tax=Luteibacter aegosomaticola TaxID=2911538 RepID=UPI001FF8B09E|nr:LysR family transcriptional regulator [Luteibacter aegosomaticola]UPG92262.1 LysR family transcriptional regulator [Luteibacter aegosomaticola]
MATDRLGDMRLFVEAASLGSLTAAGRKLGFSPAAASARLTKLEAALGAKLFDRSTRQLRLTEEGRIYQHHCGIALQAIDDAGDALHANQGEVQGKVRISASADFGRHLLNDWIEEFTRTHPALKIALTLSDSLSDLLNDDADFAIRFGKPDNESLVARRLAPNWRVLCASPGYLAEHGMPETIPDLANHQFVVLVTADGPLNTFHFAASGRRVNHTVAMENAWETNDGALARAWALAGRGVARKTIWDVAADLRNGSLQVVLPDLIEGEPGIYAVFHPNRYMSPRVRVLLDFLVERFQEAADGMLAGLPSPKRPTYDSAPI